MKTIKKFLDTITDFVLDLLCVMMLPPCFLLDKWIERDGKRVDAKCKEVEALNEKIKSELAEIKKKLDKQIARNKELVEANEKIADKAYKLTEENAMLRGKLRACSGGQCSKGCR